MCRFSMSLAVEFTWPEDLNQAPLHLSVRLEDLNLRDPDGTSLFAAKSHFEGSGEKITLSATGPGDDEYFCPELLTFIVLFVKTGELTCPIGLDCSDCEIGLDYFGFGTQEVVISEEDPQALGKAMEYMAYRKAMEAAPKIVSWVADKLRSGCLGFGGVHFVVDGGKPSTNIHYEAIDVLLDMYSTPGPGMKAARLGHRNGEVNNEECAKLLSGDNKASTSLRTLVMAGVNLLGGIKATWEHNRTRVKDIGEYGIHEYQCEMRWSLVVAMDLKRDHQKGIVKRRKLNEENE